MSMQKEMQKQMSSAVAGPVNKEGKSVDGESWGGQCWCFVGLFPGGKHKAWEGWAGALAEANSLTRNCMNKDLPEMFERAFSFVGQVSSSSSHPCHWKIYFFCYSWFSPGFTLSTSFPEKSDNSKLEATVARHIQAQFQTFEKPVFRYNLHEESNFSHTYRMPKALFLTIIMDE